MLDQAFPRSVSPNYGKPVVADVFESARWIGDITVWITGEAELLTVQVADGRNVSRQYDLASPDDVEVVFDEPTALIVHGSVPDGAVTAWIKRGK